MAISFTRLSWWWLGGKEKEQLSNGSTVNSINSPCDWGLGLRGEAPESLRFHSVKEGDRRKPPSSSSRNCKRKWKSREERKGVVDKEYDVVLVPSDGVCLSGWESHDSDWSIGWLEPHGPNFQSDDEENGSFAVLVPCYKHHQLKEENEKGSSHIHFLNSVHNLNRDYSADSKKYIEQWLSCLQDF